VTTRSYAPGESDDPRIRSARFLGYDQRQYSALTELLNMRQDGRWELMPEDYQWLLAQAHVDFAMRGSAMPIYDSLAETTSDSLLLARSRLRLAELQFQRGYTDESRKTLNAMRENLPKDIIVDWQDLMARVLMEDGRFGEAQAVLSEFKTGDEQSPYTRYNLAIALLNDGQIQKGRDVLDRLGRIRVVDLETLALRDRANLTLAWNFLKAQLGGTAKPIFYRIRTEGPYSNRALLGLGWAELAPRGERQMRDLPDDQTPFTTFSSLGGLLRPGFLERDVFKRANLRFRLGDISKDEEEALARALVPWVELTNRDPMDSAVQEAWLAIPYSLERLGAHQQALQYYQRAAEELDKNRRRIAVAEESIKGNRMVETIVRRDIDAESGWEWRLRDLPDAPETYYLQNLLAEHRFQEALKNYRDIRLPRNLDRWAARLSEFELAYVARGQGGDEAETAQVLKLAKEGWIEPWRGMTIPLRLEEGLSAPGAFDDPLTPTELGPMPLTLAAAPARFNGPLERIARLRAVKDRLREQLAAAGGEQAKLLQHMAIRELRGQKLAVDKYLVEARFALARLYDTVLKPKADPDAGTKKAAAEDTGGFLDRFLEMFGVRDSNTRQREKTQ
jgi:tetratricopeptide (TPR) repeat protein